MTEIEYDILDELYFVNTFEYLLKETGLDEKTLLSNLKELIKRDWVKCFSDDAEVNKKDIDLGKKYNQYLFLATKKGLMAHNAGD